LGLKNLEDFLYDEAYLELVCSVWLHLGCLGSNLFAEGNELFWSVSIPHNSSWCWRKILNLRSMAQGFIKFEVGDGKHIHLRMDHWHPFGVLLENFGYRIIYDSQSRLDTKLDSVLRNGLWCWKPAWPEALVALQSKLSEIPLGITGKPIWTIAKKGTYISAETWNFLRKKKDNVDWWHLVWFPHAIPKQAFILWLTMHNRLSTGDRLLAWGKCVFCRNSIESRDHIFFSPFPIASPIGFGELVCRDAILWPLLQIG